MGGRGRGGVGVGGEKEGEEEEGEGGEEEGRRRGRRRRGRAGRKRGGGGRRKNGRGGSSKMVCKFTLSKRKYVTHYTIHITSLHNDDITNLGHLEHRSLVVGPGVVAPVTIW